MRLKINSGAKSAIISRNIPYNHSQSIIKYLTTRYFIKKWSQNKACQELFLPLPDKWIDYKSSTCACGPIFPVLLILLSLPCQYGHKGDHSQTEKEQSFWISPWTRAGEHQTWPAFDGVCYTPQPVVGLRSASLPLIVSSHCSRPQEAPVNTKKVSTYACSTVILVISKAN